MKKHSRHHVRSGCAKFAGLALAAVLAVFPSVNSSSGPLRAETYSVGAGKSYANLETLRTSTIFKNGDIIDIYGNDTSLLGALRLQGSGDTVTLRSSDLNGVTISYAGLKNEAGRLADFSRGGFLLGENLTFAKFKSNGNGGVARVADTGILSTAGAHFTDNTSDGWGGVLFNDGATAHLRQGVFQNNAAVWGGVLGAVNGTTTVNGSSAMFNEAQFGGVFAVERGALTIADAVVSDNGATADGGALFLKNASATVMQSVFEYNSADGFGGAIYVEGNSTLTLGAEAGQQTRFAFNSDNGGSNAIHFNLDSADNSLVTQRLTIVGDGDTVIEDSLRAVNTAGNRSTLLVDKSGGGSLFLGGQNLFGGGVNTTMAVREGVLELNKNAVVEIATGHFVLEDGATLTANGRNRLSVIQAASQPAAITLQSGSRIELDMNGLNPGDEAVAMLLLDGHSASGATSVSVGEIVINVTSVKAYSGNDDYLLVQADGADFSNATLLVGGQASQTTPINDRSGTRTIRVNGDEVWLTLSGVDINRSVTWNGTTDGLWSEDVANWDVTGKASNAFLNGDDVVFDSTYAADIVTDITVDQNGVAAGRMIFTGGDFTFTGGEVHTSLIRYEGNAQLRFDSRTLETGIYVMNGVTAGLAALDEHDVTITTPLNVPAVQAENGSVLNIGQDGGTGTVRFAHGRNTGSHGGGIIQGDTVRILGGTTVFSGNSAQTNGGAIFAQNIDILGGNVTFENNAAQHGKGGAIYATGNVSIAAKGGDVIFRGNTTNGAASAFYMENGGSGQLRLTAEAGRSIQFFDPIENAAGRNLDVLINGSGTVLFDQYRSNITGTTSVSSGTLKLTGGAAYGALVGNTEFRLRSNAVLETEGSGNIVTADHIVLSGGSTIRVNLNNADQRGNDPALLLQGAVEIVDGDKITLDILQASRDGVFTVVSAPGMDFEGKVNTTFNGRAPSAEIRNDRYGSSEFTFSNGKIMLELEGYDQNRSVKWTGTESAFWSENDANWSTAPIASEFFLNGDSVVFDNNGANQSVSVATSGVAVGGMRVTGGNYTFDGGSISALDDGQERLLEKSGQGVLTLNQKNIFDAVQINGGTLAGGNRNGFTIQGDLLIGFGAKLSPGTQGAGQLQIDGNAQFASGSYIYLDLGKTQDKSDQIHVTGMVDFAADREGTVTVVVANNGVGQGKQASDGAVILADSGLFLNGNEIVAGVTMADNDKIILRDGGNKIIFQSDGSLDLQSAVVSDYGQDGASLALQAVGGSQTAAVAASAYTWNQMTVKDAIKSGVTASFANQLMAKFSLQNGEEAQQQFLEQLLPTLQSAMPMVTQRAITQFRQVNFERLRNLYYEPVNRYDRYFNGDALRRTSPGPTGQNAPPQAGTVRGQRLDANAAPIIWLQNYGDFMKQGTQAVQGYESEAYGVSLGTERWMSHRTVVGLGFAGAFAAVRTDDSSQKADANTFIFAPYLAHSTQDGYKILASLGYAYNDYNITRTPGGTEITSSHNGNTFLMNVEVSKKIRGLWTDVAPFAGFELIYLDEEGYAEKTSKGVVAARVNGRTSDSFLQTLGLRFGRTKTNRWGWIVNPAVSVSWIHDYGDGEIRSVSSYAGGTSFAIRGASMNRDRFALGLNYAANVNERFSFFGGYNAEFASRFDVHTIQAGLTMEF